MGTNNGISNNTKAILAGITANVIWGFSFMVIRIALDYIDVSMLLSIRFIASLLIMLILIAVGVGKVSLKGKPVGLLLLMGLCEPVIYFFAETYGVKFTTSSFSGLMISLIPITTALLSAVTIHEHLTLRRFLWIMCSVAGVGIISVQQTSEGFISIKGIICLLIAIVSASFFSILSRTVSRSFSAFERTFIMMLMGCVCFTMTALFEHRTGYLPAFSAALHEPHIMLPVLFLSLVCSVIAFFCTHYAMTYLELSRAVVFSNITPLVSVIAGVVFLGEPFSLLFLVGIALILIGVYKVNQEN